MSPTVNVLGAADLMKVHPKTVLDLIGAGALPAGASAVPMCCLPGTCSPTSSASSSETPPKERRSLDDA